MSAISDFAVKINQFNTRQDAAIADLVVEIKAQNDTIEKFQNSTGDVTSEDQGYLDALEARSDAMTTKLEALAGIATPVPPSA